MVGGEVQWGKRENYDDGWTSTTCRVQFSAKYNFSSMFGGSSEHEHPRTSKRELPDPARLGLVARGARDPCSLAAALVAQAAMTPADIQAALDAAYAKYKDLKEGKNADYIPALAKVDPNIFGIALVTVGRQGLHRRRHQLGRSRSSRSPRSSPWPR